MTNKREKTKMEKVRECGRIGAIMILGILVATLLLLIFWIAQNRDVMVKCAQDPQAIRVVYDKFSINPNYQISIKNLGK